MLELVNHPEHYRKAGRKECIAEMMEIFGPEAVYWFCVCSAYKYDYRAGEKDGQPPERDFRKKDWYLDYAAMLVAEGKVDKCLMRPSGDAGIPDAGTL